MIRITVPNADGQAVHCQIAAVTRAEFEANCEASGYEIVIAVTPAFGAEATLRLAGRDIALGQAEITFDQPIAPDPPIPMSGESGSR